MSLRLWQGRIDWPDLRLVLAVGETGTLTGAARRLGVDHSTAFRRLGTLEGRLGVRLFERARDGYAPTPAGEAAIAGAKRLLAELDDLERRLAGEDLRPSGTVRITTTDTLLDLLAPLVTAFRAAHPQITIELVAAQAFFALSRRDADIAVRPAAAPPEELAGRRIATLATALYAAPGYLAKRPACRDLTSHDWIGLDDSLSHLGSARWVRTRIPPERIVCRANSLLALRALARGGLGVAPLPCYLADTDPTLIRVRAPLPAMESALWLLVHPDLRRVARIRLVMDFAAAWLADQRPLLEGLTRPGDNDVPHSRN